MSDKQQRNGYDVTTEQVVEYYDKFVEHLKHDHERESPRHAKVKRDLAELVKPGMQVLDVGCGTGITSKFMAERGAIVTAIDISPKMIEFARENSAHENVTYMVADFGEPLELGEHNLVTMVDCVEHIPEAKLETVAENIARTTAYVLYVNAPDSRFQHWMNENHPDKLQVIDSIYGLYGLASHLSNRNYQVLMQDYYGIDAPAQYMASTFVPIQWMIKNWEEMFADRQ